VTRRRQWPARYAARSRMHAENRARKVAADPEK
jgi:hypothetical protein